MAPPTPAGPLTLPSTAVDESMTDEDFAELRALVYKLTGISLADSKRTMLASRITTRLRQLGVVDFRAYRTLLGKPAFFAQEQQALINAVTTNKTGFFREGHQFDFMRDELVPSFVARRGPKEIFVWSAACSTGQEPWTIAMTLADALPSPEQWKVRILATDIDTEVLGKAEAGRYRGSDLDGLTPDQLNRHFDQLPGGEARIKDSLRGWLTFRKLNFIDENWPLTKKFDFVMCRNASIYFDAPTQRTLFNRLANQLTPSGWLFVGHAEVLSFMADRLDAKPGGIYRIRQGAGPAPSAPPPRASAPSPSAPPRPSSPPSASAPRPSAPPARASAPAPLPRPSRPPPVPLPRQKVPHTPQSPGAAEQLDVVTIHVGESKCSTDPVEIKTLLGSCVAACLYDPVAKVGGMNHFLLPNSTVDDAFDRQRFGTHAMETLINGLMNLGADRRRLKGKLFGGGNVLPNITRHPTVGEQNASFAEDFLQREGIELVSSRLGGDSGVEVRFHTHSGRAFVRDIARDDAAVQAEERESSTKGTLKAGDVELF